MSDDTTRDQDKLLVDLLGEIFEQTDPVPTDVLEFARAAFDWPVLEVALAELD